MRELKRSGVPTKLLCKVYISIIRPVLEYACPVWCTSLSKEMRKLCKKELAELSCQKPHNYTEACLQLGLPNLETRHRKICEKIVYCHKKGKSQTSPSTSTQNHIVDITSEINFNTLCPNVELNDIKTVLYYGVFLIYSDLRHLSISNILFFLLVSKATSF